MTLPYRLAMSIALPDKPVRPFLGALGGWGVFFVYTRHAVASLPALEVGAHTFGDSAYGLSSHSRLIVCDALWPASSRPIKKALARIGELVRGLPISALFVSGAYSITCRVIERGLSGVEETDWTAI
ncbi:hypothetical protein GGX14DRAFT_399805 [Mycena pura]|uniref:Uncharacterized protein n=1 Tax=Mycena pura TaxID=153505 RepID=A0AAD6YC72_9AGAR|nr:hypothetical protein GGX14DRAFT_399805 [Mycena pura]